MKVAVAASERTESLASPHTPWPLVQPLPSTVPAPTIRPASTVARPFVGNRTVAGSWKPSSDRHCSTRDKAHNEERPPSEIACLA